MDVTQAAAGRTAGVANERLLGHPRQTEHTLPRLVPRQGISGIRGPDHPCDRKFRRPDDIRERQGERCDDGLEALRGGARDR